MSEIKGTIKRVNETNVISDKFQKREFVLTDDNSEYPQILQLQLTQKNCDKLDGFSEGDRVNVKYNLRGREWTNPSGEVKVFNTIECWWIEKEDVANNAQTPISKTTIIEDLQEDDLPF